MKNKSKNRVILMICICLVLCSVGCVTMAKNALKPTPTPTPIPTETPIINNTINQTILPTPTILYSENIDEYMFRYGGHWLGEWVQYKRDDVEGKKDINLRATIYKTFFLPNYQYWSVSWGQYFWQTPANGMKYLIVLAHIRMEGTTQESDPRIWGPGQDHFIVQIGNKTYETDKTHEIGFRIKELENTNDLMNVSKIYDYGYMRIYDRNGKETSTELGYIRMGVSNAWDGFLIFEIPRTTKLDEIIIHERIDGLGNVWWYAIPKPLSNLA